MIYRNDPFAEENICPNGHPAQAEYDEWSEEIAESTNLGNPKRRKNSISGRKKRLKEMDEVLNHDLNEV